MVVWWTVLLATVMVAERAALVSIVTDKVDRLEFW